MLHRARGLALLVLLVFARPVSAATADLAKNPKVVDAIAAFDIDVQRIMADREQPGVSIGLVYRDQLFWAKGYGWADVARKVPATPTTAYRIASITKTFTATAILQLRDQGRLRLDDPVVKYVPWFTPRDTFPGDPPITIRHLMTHASGLERELEATYWDDGRFPDHASLVKLVQDSYVIRPREQEVKYSNVAVAVEGEIVAAVSGEPWAGYVQRHILDPLGMSHTQPLPSRDMPELATGYSVRAPGRPRTADPYLDLRAMSPCGSIASTVEDLSRWLSFQFADTLGSLATVLAPASLREMHRVQHLADDWSYGFGLAWIVQRVGEQVRISHSGGFVGYITYVGAAPADRFGVIVLTNADDGNAGLYAKRAWAIVAPAVKEATATSPHAAADSSWAEYAGEYEWRLAPGATVRVLLRSDGLFVLDMQADDPWVDRIELLAVARDVFRMKNGDQAGELVRFERDASGRVVRIVEPGYAADRRVSVEGGGR